MNGSTTEIELLAWEDCPSHPKAMQLIRHTLRQIGMGHVEVKLRFIETHEQAVAERFVGSPTFREARSRHRHRPRHGRMTS